MLFGLLTRGMAEAKTSPQFATPHFIGSERRWIVARVGYRDHAVCYAFTYPVKDGAGDRPVLFVSDYPHHLPEIALKAGYRHNVPVRVSVNLQHPRFFARDGYAFAVRHMAIIHAFRKGVMVYAMMPGSGGQRVTDAFSLMGFTRAYAKLRRACDRPGAIQARVARTIGKQSHDKAGPTRPAASATGP
ncbi:MAG: hypothetical protein ACYCX8_12460 [Acidimicrobiales bacterium]